MSSTTSGLQPPQASAVDPAALEALGTSPLALMLGFHVPLLLAGPVILVLGFMIDTAPSIMGGVFLALCWAPIALVMLPWIIYNATVGMARYGAARAAVEGGEISPSYALRDRYCQVMCLVDDGAKRLWIGGEGFDFSQVKHASWTSSGSKAVVEIQMRKGAEPLKSIPVEGRAEALRLFGKLENSLGLG
jgi:hypothetical protein